MPAEMRFEGCGQCDQIDCFKISQWFFLLISTQTTLSMVWAPNGYRLQLQASCERGRLEECWIGVTMGQELDTYIYIPIYKNKNNHINSIGECLCVAGGIWILASRGKMACGQMLQKGEITQGNDFPFYIEWLIVADLIPTCPNSDEASAETACRSVSESCQEGWWFTKLRLELRQPEIKSESYLVSSQNVKSGWKNVLGSTAECGVIMFRWCAPELKMATQLTPPKKNMPLIFPWFHIWFHHPHDHWYGECMNIPLRTSPLRSQRFWWPRCCGNKVKVRTPVSKELASCWLDTAGFMDGPWSGSHITFIYVIYVYIYITVLHLFMTNIVWCKMGEVAHLHLK